MAAAGCGWLTLAAVDVDKELVYLERALKQRPEDRQIHEFLLEASLTHHDLKRALRASKGLQDAHRGYGNCCINNFVR